MSITFEVPSELALELEAEARRYGLSVATYILQIIADRQTAKNLPRTGAELIAYWEREQLIGSRSDIADSQAYARQLRSEAESRHR
ncbi:MAG: hypothetical protein AB7U82_12120 [Blastocatellales bacterium]